jgi:hypothetical protein
MLRAEDEAAEMICPRLSTAEQDRFCMGAQCMAWRWWNLSDDTLEPDALKDALGFCGLAGRP